MRQPEVSVFQLYSFCLFNHFFKAGVHVTNGILWAVWSKTNTQVEKLNLGRKSIFSLLCVSCCHYHVLLMAADQLCMWVSGSRWSLCLTAILFLWFHTFRSRNVRGLRAMWNKGRPLPFAKKWNPFNNDIPWTTYMSHPLLWQKGKQNNYKYLLF